MIAALLLLACAPEPTPSASLAELEAEAPLVDVAVSPSGTSDVAPADRRPGRDRKRMDVDQLSAAITQVAGGIAWTDGEGRAGADMFAELSATLGKPDYSLSTREDLAPSVIFSKFLNDAAMSVCTKLIEAEEDGADGAGTFLVDATLDDTLQTAPDAVEDNIRRQLLRFHGRDLPPGDAELDAWLWLWETVHARTGDTGTAWRAVCVGLVTHPEFYTY